MANHNYIFKTATEALPQLLGTLLDNADEVGSRDGRTKEMTHIGITLTEPWKRELLLPGRKPNLAAQIAETMWVLAGRDDVEWLERYLPRAPQFSDDGKFWRGAYGPRIRGIDYVNAPKVDQVAWVVKELCDKPLTRQAVINIYDAQRDMGVVSKDIPCNDFLQFTNRLGKLDLHVYIRSNDAIWGWSGINAFEWSALQEIVAGLVGVGVGSLHFSVGSFHVYDRHWGKAQRIIDDGNVDGTHVADSPAFRMSDDNTQWPLNGFDDVVRTWFEAEEAIRTGSTLAPTLVSEFPEPMLRSWLRVIQWWWSGDKSFLAPLSGTRLDYAAFCSVQPTFVGFPEPEDPKPTLIDKVVALHNEKDAAYGDSWCKRGEQISIMANIARKVDRIESGKSTQDENQLDTAMDLFVYCAKYKAWIQTGGVPDRDRANEIMRDVANTSDLLIQVDKGDTRDDIPGAFAHLEMAVVNNGDRETYLEDLLELAWVLVLQS